MDEGHRIPYGICQCGCDREAPGVLYLTGHQGRDQGARDEHRQIWKDAGIEYGLCLCGCGSKTPIAKGTKRRSHILAGEPTRYILGHHQRKSPAEYIEEDHGYSTPCWIWQRGLRSRGYGSSGSGKAAHRAMYERLVGPIPDGLTLDHLCRVHACVNPGHLEPVTHAENVRRGTRAKLTPEAVAYIRSVPESAVALAGKYGVSKSVIYDVRKGRTWKMD